MEIVGFLFVQKPLNSLIVAVLFFVGSRVLGSTEFGQNSNPRALLMPAIAWALYAVWELVVMLRTPEANIRVDLLMIYPILAILSLWFIIKALR